MPSLDTCVLVADDSAPIRRIFGRILGHAGYTILEAADGKDVVEQLRVNRIDLALIDLHMPDLDGLALAREIQREFPQVRIVLMSGAFDNAACNDAQTLGIDAILGKPSSPELLLDTVERVLTSVASRMPAGDSNWA